ncbi:hypothetical protein J6590_008961 [Homalodisca vitripennis]|nr:hypothetical protein J6590_008961 [Homalodisca vitripennis]
MVSLSIGLIILTYSLLYHLINITVRGVKQGYCLAPLLFLPADVPSDLFRAGFTLPVSNRPSYSRFLAPLKFLWDVRKNSYPLDLNPSPTSTDPALSYRPDPKDQPGLIRLQTAEYHYYQLTVVFNLAGTRDHV